MNKKKFFRISKNTDAYRSEDGEVVQREWGNSPHMNNIDGRWAYRNAWGKLIDYSAWRNDLADKYDFELVEE